MATASTTRSLQRFASRQVLLAVVVVLFAMIALALLAEVLTSGDGGTVYLAEIQPAAQPGSLPSLVAIGYGQAMAPAETAAVQLLFTNFDGYSGTVSRPTPGATPGAAEREAAGPIVMALVAAGIPEDAVAIVTSATFSSGYYGPPGAQMFRVNFEMASPNLEVLTSAVNLAAAAGLENGLQLAQAGVAYGVADCGPLRARAWDAAVADARARADAQAAQLEVNLGDLLVSQETAGDAAALLGSQGRGGGCAPVGDQPINYFGPIAGATITLPPFDPTAAPNVVAYTNVTMAFEIVRD